MAITSYDQYQAKYNTYQSLAGKTDPTSMTQRRALAKELQGATQYRTAPTGAAPTTGGTTLSGTTIPDGALKVGVNSWISKPKSQTAQAGAVAKSPTLQGVINANPTAATAINPQLTPNAAPAPTTAPAAEAKTEAAPAEPSVYDAATDQLASDDLLGDLGNAQFDDKWVNDLMGQLNGATTSPPTRGPLQTESLIGNDFWGGIKDKLAAYLNGGAQYKLPTEEELKNLMGKIYTEQIQNARTAGGVDAKQTQQRRAREQYLADRGISFDSDAYRTDQRNTEEAIGAEDAAIRYNATQTAMQAAKDEFKRRADAVDNERRGILEPFQQAGVLATADADRLAKRQGDREMLDSQEWATGADIKSREKTTGATILGNIGTNREGITSQEKRDKIEAFTGNLRFLSQLGFNFKELGANIDKWAADRGLTKETFYAQLDADNKKFAEDMKLKIKSTIAAIQNAKDLTALEKAKLVELARSNRAQEAIAMIVAKKGGRASADEVFATTTAQLEATELFYQKYPEARPNKKTGAGGVSVGFGG